MDMDELDDDNTIPLQPVPQSAPKPLPRMWKDEDDDEGETRPIRSAAPVNPPRAPAPTPDRPKAPAPLERTGSKPKPKAKASADDDGERKGKLEATPLLDTYDTRKRVRVVFGVGIGLVALVLIVFGLKMLGGSAEEDVLVDEGGVVERAKADAQDRDEEEAKTLFGNAKQVAVNGKVNDARAMLEKLIKSYPKTVATREAKEALERPSKNLPMFLDVSSTVVAAPPEPAPKPEPPKEEPARPTLLANAPPPPPNTSGSGDAVIFRPSNAPDSSKPNMLKKDATPGAYQPPQPVGKPIPAGFQPRTEAGLDPSGYPREIVSDRDGATMVFIPGGTFNMGSESGDPAERPVHPVTLTPYYIDQHEVTVKQFSLYTRETSKRVEAAPPPSAKAADPQAALNFPIVGINARDARAYCEWAGKRLPTEAQWEMAARTTDGRLYPWGNAPASWPRARASRQVDQVMSFENDRSPYNVYDLAGNAWEWTMDYYDAKYYQQVARGATNPPGPLTSRFKPALVTVKGGSKTFHASWREGLKVDARFPYVGFRGVLVLPDAPAPAPPGGTTTASPTPSGTNPPPPPTGNTSAPVPF